MTSSRLLASRSSGERRQPFDGLWLARHSRQNGIGCDGNTNFDFMFSFFIRHGRDERPVRCKFSFFRYRARWIRQQSRLRGTHAEGEQLVRHGFAGQAVGFAFRVENLPRPGLVGVVNALGTFLVFQ